MAIPSRVFIRNKSTSNSANGGERLLQAGPPAVAAGHAVIEVHAVVADAELAQRVALRSEILLVGRAARVANEHVGTWRRHGVGTAQRRDEVLLHEPTATSADLRPDRSASSRCRLSIGPARTTRRWPRSAAVRPPRPVRRRR
jgi:hypothetical protein